MKTASLALPAIALLALACNDSTSPSSSASRTAAPAIGGLTASATSGNGIVHRVSVGSHDADIAGQTDANFSLIAIQYGDGSMSGQWSDQFGQADGGIHVAVNCVHVVGNQAWISGIITKGAAGGVDFAGLPVITRVADNGDSANDPPDAISFSFIGVAAPCTATPNLPLLALTDGQVTVN